jgi:hypothetical protein
MNYGQVNPGQVSGQRVVILKMKGTSDTVAKIMIKEVTGKVMRG